MRHYVASLTRQIQMNSAEIGCLLDSAEYVGTEVSLTGWTGRCQFTTSLPPARFPSSWLPPERYGKPKRGKESRGDQDNHFASGRSALGNIRSRRNGAKIPAVNFRASFAIFAPSDLFSRIRSQQ